MITIEVDTPPQVIYVFGCEDCAYYLTRSGLCCESRSPWYKRKVLGRRRLCRCFAAEPLSNTLLRMLHEAGCREDIR